MSKNTRNRILLTALAALLLVTLTIGGTMAWLVDTTTEVKNVFTTSKVDVTLSETTNTYKMIPGYTIAKDPKVKLEAGSEESFVFVKITEGGNFSAYMTYAPAEGWEKLEDVDGVNNVWYCTLTADQEKEVLAGNIVTVKDGVTNTMMETAQTTSPTLAFTAYAVQKKQDNTTDFTPAQAWAAIANPEATTN